MKEQIHARRLQAADNKHMFETRKQKKEHFAKITKIKDSNKDTITQISKDYKNQELTEKNKVEEKLIKLRKINNRTIKSESSRFKSIIDEMKANHKSKVEELKITQESEIDKIQGTHNEYLETARQKYESELNKLES